jgi:hypothetical protein
MSTCDVQGQPELCFGLNARVDRAGGASLTSLSDGRGR